MKNKILLFGLMLLIIPCFFLFTGCEWGNTVTPESGDKEYTINFIVDDEVYSEVKTKGNQSIVLPKDPTKENNVFVGWYFDDKTFAEEFNCNTYKNSLPINISTNVYAKFNVYQIEYYDNVAIEISEFEIKDNSVKFAGSEINMAKPIVVSVNSDTEDVNYDIVALGVKISATYEESGEDCSSILDVHFSDLSQVYVNNNIQFTDGNYIRNAKNLMIYYNKVLEPGESESLIDGFRINENIDNASTNQKIVIKIKVFAVYPNPVQIREAQSEFVNAPQDWVDLVYDQLTEIFKERAKRR